MKIIFIHGRSQEEKDPAELKRVWTEALCVGLSEAGLDALDTSKMVFPYYGDDLAKMVQELRGASPDIAATKGIASTDDPLDAMQIELMKELLPAFKLGSEEPLSKGLQNTAIVRALARAADESNFAFDLLSMWTADVSAYLTNIAVNTRIRSIVQASIDKEPCVIVAHSLGSVIAYQILRQMGHMANVCQFITLGSPLGLNTIRQRISPPALAIPVGVKSWINAYDPRDIVALHPLDAVRWNVKPPIINIETIQNHMGNHHGISGYLDDKQIASAISAAAKATFN